MVLHCQEAPAHVACLRVAHHALDVLTLDAGQD